MYLYEYSFSTLKILATVKQEEVKTPRVVSFSTLKILATVKLIQLWIKPTLRFSTLKILATVKPSLFLSRW